MRFDCSKLRLILIIVLIAVSVVFGNEIDQRKVKSVLAIQESNLANDEIKFKPSRGQLSGRINDGNVIKNIKDFPYQAGILMNKNDRTFVWCGGVIIAADCILTAAHCFKDITSGTLYLGTVNRIIPEPSAKLIPFDISDVTIHEKYDSITFHNDIALIRVKTFQLNDFIKAMDLISRNEARDNKIDGKTAAVSGWGHNFDNDNFMATENLQSTSVKLVSKSKCKEQIMQANLSVKLNDEVDDMICIENPTSTGHCKGDSGGPVVSLIENTKKLVGIVSHTIKRNNDAMSTFCERPLARVFTRVSSYARWICDNADVCTGI